jgi:hypothetical protein
MVICGDGTVGAGEVCDDGNTLHPHLPVWEQAHRSGRKL